MGAAFRLSVSHNEQTVYAGNFDQPVELGRQRTYGEPLFFLQRQPGGWRMAIAAHDEVTIPREQLRLERCEGDRVTVTNLSGKSSVIFDGAEPLPASQSARYALPVRFSIGEARVRVEPTEEEEAKLRSLSRPTLLPGDISGLVRRLDEPAPLLPQDTERLMPWLQTLIGVLQSAANSEDFFARAAQGIVRLAGLDSGGVLLLVGDAWEMQSMATREGPLAETMPWKPSNFVLAKMREQKRTFWTAPQGISLISASLLNVQAVVVAPILNRAGEVIGALYGDRQVGPARRDAMEITQLDAMLVEALACGIAAGLSRLEQERAAMAAQIRFEQFFSPELSQELAVRPDLLVGRDVEVTLLFCDIRGFSRISERLGPARTVEWLGDMMNVFSDCVARCSGVLVDFIGDELLAMWGALRVQPDHADLGCRAALEILATLPALNERWRAILGEPIRLGIGLNTGVARVGNTGSDKKFKYGPLGNTVNLASRVQGATKYFKTDVLITAATRAQATALPLVRRLGQVRVVNIVEPVELYELRPTSDSPHAAQFAAYERALVAFEQQHFRRTAQALSNILDELPDDGPSLQLLSRVVRCLTDPPEHFQPVWQLSEK